MALPNLHSTVFNALATGGMDAAKAVLDDATKLVLLSAEAGNFSDANTNLGSGSGKKIAEITIVPTDISVGGTGQARKVSFAGKIGGSVTVPGPADPVAIALLDMTNSIILAQVSESGTAVFSSGGSITVPAFDIVTFGALA